MAKTLTETLYVIYPYKLYLANVYDNIVGGADHWYIAYDSWNGMHFLNAYNIVVGATDPFDPGRPEVV